MEPNDETKYFIQPIFACYRAQQESELNSGIEKISSIHMAYALMAAVAFSVTKLDATKVDRSAMYMLRVIIAKAKTCCMPVDEKVESISYANW